MINKERMIKEFIELVSIDSISLNERNMADTLRRKLEALGLEVIEDDAGKKAGGSSGNLIGFMKGNKNVPGILLMAHMDTVTPGLGKKPVIEGNVIKSDGTTVLGSDDAAGIECILEAIRNIKEEKFEHGNIQIAFTIAEEIGLIGAKNLNYDKINSKYGFVLDGGGKIGTVAIQAPSQNHIDVTIIGKAAHAGLEPEKGTSAIQIAGKAVSIMKLGRIDPETTANIGIINGGSATNIICDRVEIKAEARSCDPRKLEAQTLHMKQCFENAASEFGGKVEFKSELMYPAYKIKEDDKIVSILKKASDKAGIELVLEATGGGSDTNIINGKGVQAVDISVGMSNVHSVSEYIEIDDMFKASAFLAEIIKAVE